MWVFRDGYKISLTNTSTAMAFDGAQMWVTNGTSSYGGVDVVRFWGEGAGSKSFIDLSSYLDYGPAWIVKGGNYMFVFDGTSSKTIYKFLKIDITTKQVVLSRTLPQPAFCYPDFNNFRIWFSTAAPTDSDLITDVHQLFFYNMVSDSFSGLVDIPAKKQFEAKRISWARDNYVFVNALNDNSVLKFNNSTGSYVSQIVVNRRPSGFHGNDSRELIVASSDGMVSSINQTLNTSTNFAGILGTTTSIFDDGTYLWYVNPNMACVAKNDVSDNYRVMDGDTKDYCFDAFTDISFKQIFVTPSLTYNRWQTIGSPIGFVSTTVPSYIVMLADNRIYFATNLSDSWPLEENRNYYLNVKLTSMIGTGPQVYYGETI